jgi:hypothetical protein
MKIVNWFKNIFKKKPIIIPLVRNGIKTGQWIECYKGDETFKKLVQVYGEPLPTQIEVVPYNEDKNV